MESENKEESSNVYSCPRCSMTFKSHFLMRRHLDQLCVGNDTVMVPRSPKTPEDVRRQLTQRRDYREDNLDEVPMKDEVGFNALGPERQPSTYAPKSANRDSPPLLNPDEEEKRMLDEIQRLHTELYGDALLDDNPNQSFLSRDVTPTIANQSQMRAPSRQKSASTRKPNERELISEIQKRAKDLDQRKEEIQRQLAELQVHSTLTQKSKLNPQPSNAQENEYESIVRAIREQDEQLAKATEAIRDEIRLLKKERLKNDSAPVAATRLPTIPYQPNNPASQVNALKSAYLMSGGHDRNLIRQMNETMGDAIGKQVMNYGYPHNSNVTGADFGPGAYPNESTLPASHAFRLMEFERENRLIMQELELLRYHKSNEESEVEKVQRMHYMKMLNMQQEIESLRAEAYLKHIRDALNPPAKPPPPFKESPHLMMPSNPYSSSHDSLHSQPYDPTAGFVIFYDFLLNIDPAYDRMQIIVSLYNGPHEICTPKVLPERDCYSQGVASSPSVQLLNTPQKFCLLSISQPVQKCRPGPDLCLVVEVQAQSSFVPRQKTIGWSKVLLFDNQLRVLSGRWRTPIRLIPVRTDMIPKDLNTIPQCGMMELYYRISNYRDADVQASVKISPTNAHEYKYTPQAFGHPVYYQAPAPVQAPQEENVPPVIPTATQVELPEWNPSSRDVPAPPSSDVVSGGSSRGGTKKERIPVRKPTPPPPSSEAKDSTSSKASPKKTAKDPTDTSDAK